VTAAPISPVAERARPAERLQPLVSVIVPVRNDAHRLEQCLASIANTRYPADRLEILVADNGSTDTSPDVAKAMGARVLVFPDIRVSEVRNQAARAARGDVLAFVDADHVLEADWLPDAVESLLKPDAAAVGAAYYAPPQGTWVQRMYDSFRVRAAGVQQVDWLGSGSLAVWREVFERVGGFDSRLETCEDVDFCQRLRRGGFGLWSDNRLRSIHLGDPRTLRALFFGELWRGRDNLKVSLRGPLSWRGVPSVIIPLGILLLLTMGLASLVALPGSWRLLAIAIGGPLLLTSLRAARMLSRIRRFDPLTLARAFTVAFVYDVSRALALVVRTPHRVRQNASLSAKIPGSRA
jgi:glycosyltransferase involved in cell wall biosynthesis